MILNYFKTNSELERISDISQQKSKTVRKDIYPQKIVTPSFQRSKHAASSDLESDFITGTFLKATSHSELGVAVPVLSMCSDMVATEHEQNKAV